MSEENDFISLWKKNKGTQAKPSAIGDTIDKLSEAEKRCQDLEAENSTLKQNIKENIEIMNKTEAVLKNLMAEKEQLIQEKKKAVMDVELRLNNEISQIKDENTEYVYKFKVLEEKLKSQEDELVNLRQLESLSESEKEDLLI